MAEAAGVTVSTASRALHRPELVRPETRERVQAAARALGYVPNRMAQAIATGRSQTIAFILPDLHYGLFHTVAATAQAEAHARKHDLVVVDSMASADREAALIETIGAYADGVILLWPQGHYTPSPTDPPVVAIGRPMTGAHSVLLDQAFVVEEQLRHLRALGHERILWTDGPDWYWGVRARRRHARRLARDYPFTISAPVELSYEGGREIAESLDPSVTAVMTMVDNQALGVIAGLAERGVRVPDDVSVIGCNDVMWAHMANPALTTLRTPFPEMGRAAVSLLLDAEPAADGPQIVETLRSELVVRRSTAPPGGPPAA